MDNKNQQKFPKWIFSILAIGGFIASGIYIGIISIEGITALRVVQMVGFFILGLLMFWGAISQR